MCSSARLPPPLPARTRLTVRRPGERTPTQRNEVHTLLIWEVRSVPTETQHQLSGTVNIHL